MFENPDEDKQAFPEIEPEDANTPPEEPEGEPVYDQDDDEHQGDAVIGGRV